MSEAPTSRERVASIFIDAPVETVWEEITLPKRTTAAYADNEGW